jgi:hypothetical protein
VINIESLVIEIDGKKISQDIQDGRMLVAYNKTPFKIFDEGDMSCWIEVKVKECGKKVKLSGETIIEMKNGDQFNGKSFKRSARISDEDPGFFVGIYSDEVKVGSNNKTVKVSYTYSYRYESGAMAYK